MDKIQICFFCNKPVKHLFTVRNKVGAEVSACWKDAKYASDNGWQLISRKGLLEKIVDIFYRR